MVSHMHTTSSMSDEVFFYYGVRVTEQYQIKNVLSLPRLLAIADARPQFHLSLFLSGGPSRSFLSELQSRCCSVQVRRLEEKDVAQAVSSSESDSRSGDNGMVCYVCGPPKMTDHFVEYLKQHPKVLKERVFCEKWW